mgnify:CR=1 FL=1
MNPELAIDFFKSTVVFSLYMVAPFLGVLLVVGLVASLLQSVTSMQEQTLTFAPKLLALAGLAKANPEVRVFISGDRDARHGDVIRVLDIVRGTGVQKVAFEIRSADK